MANLHLPLLQAVAWTGMLVKYSQNVSFVDAVEMTFDGDHPCPMCKAIKKQETARPALKEMTTLLRPILFLETPVRWVQSIRWLGMATEPRFVASCFSPLPERLPPRSFA